MNYYNENDPNAAAWLRELIKQGRIPPGDVDERSIINVKPDEVRNYRQRHWFAGVGGWPRALELSGWPVDEQVDTGSCPCQPISCAGHQLGEVDDRHLWPAWHNILRELDSATIIGEQVANEDGLEWLDGISLDLECLGYAVAAADLPAASCGHHHKRQRFFWFAHANSRRGEGFRLRASLVGQTGPGGAYSKMALLTHNPFDSGPGWPQPLVRVLDDGLPGDVELLRGYGNAICPEVAATFIIAAEKARINCFDSSFGNGLISHTEEPS